MFVLKRIENVVGQKLGDRFTRIGTERSNIRFGNLREVKLKISREFFNKIWETS